MLKWKCYGNLSNRLIDKKDIIQIESFSRTIYLQQIKKSELRLKTSVDTSKLTKEVDLASLKSDINDSYIDKFRTTPIDL